MEAENSALYMWKNPFNQLAESNRTVQPPARPPHSLLGGAEADTTGVRHVAQPDG